MIRNLYDVHHWFEHVVRCCDNLAKLSLIWGNGLLSLTPSRNEDAIIPQRPARI